MIYTLIVDISLFSSEDLIKKIELCERYEGAVDEKISDEKYCDVLPCPELRAEVVSHIFDAKNEKLRHERLGAYLSLSAITLDLFGKSPEITWLENGKPIYNGENIYFSISHSQNMVAVSISDKADTGVDIESEISPERAERLDKRFFSDLNILSKPLNTLYMYAELSRAGCLCFYEILIDNRSGFLFTDVEKAGFKPIDHSESFTAKWTLLEAITKCNGSGLSSIKKLDKLLSDISADVRKVYVDDKEFYISTVTLK